jgi:hypothetical protein
MSQNIGWAEPNRAISEPRVQMVAGFTYQYLETSEVPEMAVGNYVVAFRKQLQAAYRSQFGPAALPPLLAMYLDIPGKTGVYDVQIGFVVEEQTPRLGEAKCRYVEPALIAGMIVGGDIDAVLSTYGPLMAFTNQHGLKCVVGWREWYLHWESDTSSNSITWVMHNVEEAE